MQLYRCIQVHNPPLPINLYIMGVNNEYNSHIAFDGKTKRCTTYYKLRSQATLSFLCLFLSCCLFLTIYTTQVTHPLYESSELKTLTIQFTR